MKIIFVLLMCLSTITLSALELTEHLPAGTKFFGKLDMKLLRGNNIYQKIQQENKEQINFFSAIFALMSGVNLDDIDSVYLVAKGEEDGFIVIEGNFDIQRIQQIVGMGEKNQTVQEESAIFAVEIPDNRRGGGRGKNLAVVIDEKTLAIGKPERVRELLSAIAGKGELISLKKSEALKKSYTDKHALQFSLIELHQDWYENQVLANISAADISADLVNGVDLKAKLFMVDAEITKASEKVLSGLVVFLKRIDIQAFSHDKSAKILKDEILQSFMVESNNDELLVTAHINEESLETIIRTQVEKNRAGAKINKNEDNGEKDVFDDGENQKNNQ